MKELGKFIEKSGKTLLRAGLVRLLPMPRRPEGVVDPSTVKRVLAVRQDSRLGNVLLLTPALRLIKTAFPAAKIDVLLADAYGDALRFNPCVDSVLGLGTLPFLRARGYDLAFDFSPQQAFSLSSALLTAASGARRRIGFDRGDAVRFLNDLVPVPGGQAHETANLASLVRHAAPSVALPADGDLRMEWHFGPGELEAGERTWASWGLDSNSPALFLGARAEKRLPAEWFAALAQKIRADGRRVVLFGGPAERSLLAGVALPEGALLAPELPLRAFAAVVRRAAAVVSADTGPMHLSVAVGAKTVELFSHTEPWRFGYSWMAGQRIVNTPGRQPTVDEAFNALCGVLQHS